MINNDSNIYESVSDVILNVSSLKKQYDNNGKTEVIIENLNLSVERNEFLCILGPSGCGKTTLLRCIAGFNDYDGEILIDGVEKKEPDTDRIMVFQDFNQLFPWKTVEKNIQYPLIQKGIRDKETLNELTKLYLEKVNLSGIEKKYPHQLSGGMKQRVAIAKALALKPKMILMDEPFAALDAMTRNALQAELMELSRSTDSTFIFVTHNIQEAIVLGSRIIVMGNGGKIIYDEKNTLQRPITPASKGYGEIWDIINDKLHSL